MIINFRQRITARTKLDLFVSPRPDDGAKAFLIEKNESARRKESVFENVNDLSDIFGRDYYANAIRYAMDNDLYELFFLIETPDGIITSTQLNKITTIINDLIYDTDIRVSLLLNRVKLVHDIDLSELEDLLYETSFVSKSCRCIDDDLDSSEWLFDDDDEDFVDLEEDDSIYDEYKEEIPEQSFSKKESPRYGEFFVSNSSSFSKESFSVDSYRSSMSCSYERVSFDDDFDFDLGKLDIDFFTYLCKLMDERDMSEVDCYKGANMDRKTFAKYRNRKTLPSKTNCLALAISLKLDLDDTQKLLSKCGYILSDALMGDKIVKYCINKKEYDIFNVNEILYKYDQKLLG